MVIDGEYSYRINGRDHIFGKNDLIVINSRDVHSCRIANPRNLEAVSLNIPYSLLHENYPEIDSLHFSVDNNEKVDEIRKEMWNIFVYFKQRNQIPFFESIVNSYTYKIIYLLLRYCSTPVTQNYSLKKGRNLEKMKNIVSYILENYSSDITQEMTAEDFGMARENLSRLFKKHTGVTFREFISSIRIRHALFDLLNTTDSITDIAINHGFPDSRSFSRQFRKKYGKNPVDFRKEKDISYEDMRDEDSYFF